MILAFKVTGATGVTIAGLVAVRAAWALLPTGLGRSRGLDLDCQIQIGISQLS